MTDHDQHLRDLFRDAARGAPAYDASKLVTPMAHDTGQSTRPPRVPPQPRRRRLLKAAAVAGLAVVGTTLWVVARGHDGSDAASCAAELNFAGRTYVADGALLNLPRSGKRLGEASRPGCSEGGGSSPSATVAVNAVPGTDPTKALLGDNEVWIAKGLTPAPPSIAAFNRQLPCSATQPATLGGTLAGYEGPDLSTQGPASYTLVVQADWGTAVRLRDYSWATIRLRVTPETTGSTDARFIRRALVEEGRVAALVVCTEHRFTAATLR